MYVYIYKYIRMCHMCIKNLDLDAWRMYGEGSMRINVFNMYFVILSIYRSSKAIPNSSNQTPQGLLTTDNIPLEECDSHLQVDVLFEINRISSKTTPVAQF